MHTLRVFSIISWIALPTVMSGGYAMLGFLTRNGLSDFQLTFFRPGTPMLAYCCSCRFCTTTLWSKLP